MTNSHIRIYQLFKESISMKQKVLRLRFALTDWIDDNIPKVKVLSELTLGELFDYALEVLLILMEIKESMVIQLQKKSQKFRSICFEDPSFFFLLYVLWQSGDTFLTRDWPASWSQTLGSSVDHSCISLVYRPFVLLCHWRFSELHSFLALHDLGIFLSLPLICLMVSFLTRSRVRKTTVRSWIQHCRNGGGFKVSYRLLLKRL